MSIFVNEFSADSLNELLRLVLQIEKEKKENILYYRGESDDYGVRALTPSVYRNGQKQHIECEHIYYREMQRYNDHEFNQDITAFDKLARMQHYCCPTRMIDVSEDLMSATYFALNGSGSNGQTKPVIYVLEIAHDKIKYYDSDAVSVVANLAKTPIKNDSNAEKSKEAIWCDAKQYLDCRESYNSTRLESKNYLLHDIKEEKAYFQDQIDPKHIFSVFCVKPKYTNQRLLGQKGAFLLFGLNYEEVKQSPQLFEKDGNRISLKLNSDLHPIVTVHKILLGSQVKQADLRKIGITTPYIYPELESVSEYLKEEGAYSEC